MLAQYLLYNNETLFYRKYALYKLDKISITFENHCLVNAKPLQSTFNYPKFHTITHFT